MNTQRQREIDSLRNRLNRLEQEAEQEKQQREAVEGAHQQLLESLQQSGISFDDYVRSFYKEIRKVITRIEKAQAKVEEPANQTTKKKRSVKKRRKQASRPTVTVKIPAGNYRGIPDEPERLFQVKEKGPPPKALRADAEQVGLEGFMKQCRLPEKPSAE